jgi:hypothetical protein
MKDQFGSLSQPGEKCLSGRIGAAFSNTVRMQFRKS